MFLRFFSSSASSAASSIMERISYAMAITSDQFLDLSILCSSSEASFLIDRMV